MIFLVIAAAAYLLPEALSEFGLGSEAAWAYVTYGLESAILWLYVGATVTGVVGQAAAAWGMVEAAMRPICRLSFSMHEKPPAGVNLCDAAFGFDTIYLSYLLACLACSVALVTCKVLHHASGGQDAAK